MGRKSNRQRGKIMSNDNNAPPPMGPLDAELAILSKVDQVSGLIIFALGPVGGHMEQAAFTRCLVNDWLKLADVDARMVPNQRQPVLVRIFKITTTGRARLAQLRTGMAEPVLQ